MVWQWSTNDVYSHGFLIPAISAYLVWQRRDRLSTAAKGLSPLIGSLLLLAGLGLLVVGRRVDIVGVQQLSLLPTIAGLVYLFGGPRALRVLWFPIAYLICMMPIWDVFTERLHLPFQQFSATLGAWMLKLVGVPVFHQATYLQLPNVTLEVARVCSGVNYLIAVIAIGVPVAYVAFHDTARRVLLVVFAVAIAILGNSVRVALIGVLAYYNISKEIHGPGHVLQGLFVAAVGYIALLTGVRLLSVFWPTRDARPAVPAAPHAELPGAHVRPAAWAAAAVAALLMVGVGRAGVTPVSASTAPLTGRIELPGVIGGWSMVSGFQPHIAIADATPGLRASWRAYRNADGAFVEVFLGSVVEGDAAGADDYWGELLKFGSEPQALRLSADEEVTVNRAVRTNGNSRSLVLSWYDIGGRVSTDRVVAKLATLWGRLVGGGRPPVLVVVAASTAKDGMSANAATMSFASDLIDVLRRIDGDSE